MSGFNLMGKRKAITARFASSGQNQAWGLAIAPWLFSRREGFWGYYFYFGGFSGPPLHAGEGMM